VQLLRKATKFQWTNECERIFLQLKAFLACPPFIQNSNATKPITIYLIVSEDTISTTLVQEVEKEERPIYFISRVLCSVEIRYLMIEKVVLALVIITRIMRMYFHNHRIIVKIDYPIITILAKPDLVGRMIGWTV